MEELHDLGILGENKEKEYGERLVKNITSFVQMNNLGEYIDRHASKRRKITPPSSEIATKRAADTDVVDMTDDEFDAGINFDEIELPTEATKSTPAGASKTGNRSMYFSGRK